MKMEMIERSLKSAQNWKSQNEPVWVARCISPALLHCISMAVTEHADPASGIRWLKTQSFVQHLLDYADALRDGLAFVEAGRTTISALGGNYSYIVFVHIAWLLEMDELAKWFAEVSERKDVAAISTPFWQEYARATGAFIRQEHYRVGELQKLTGQEIHWYPYLILFQALITREGIKDASLSVENAFLCRNRDESLDDDYAEIEGTGRNPAKWSFRMESVLRYADRNCLPS